MSLDSADPVPEEDSYNFIYDRLVISPDDINGMIAYSLYKREKVEFIRDFVYQHKKYPTDADLKAFHVSSNTEARLNAYKLQAGVIAREFLKISLEKKVEEIEREWREGYLQSLIGSDLKALKGFGRGVLQGVISSWVFSFSVALVLLGTVVVRLGPSDVAKEIFKMISSASSANDLPSRPAK